MKPNCTVVKFTDESKTNKPTLIEEELLEKYKVPVSLSSDHGRLEPLSRENYKQVMHDALYREENECNKKIARLVCPKKQVITIIKQMAKYQEFGIIIVMSKVEKTLKLAYLHFKKEHLNKFYFSKIFSN